MNSASEAVKEDIKRAKIVAIARKVAPKDAIPVAEALYEGGIRLLEVTFDQSDPEAIVETPKVIRLIFERFRGRLRVGAGTVISTKQVEAAFDAGAEYMISPNFDPRVVERTLELGAVPIPGAMTPTEILAAYEAGAGFVKVFPVESLGVGYLKAITAPISHVPLLAVGGVDAGNLREFLATGIAGVGVGGNIVNKKLIKEGKFAELADLARAFTSQIERG